MRIAGDGRRGHSRIDECLSSAEPAPSATEGKRKEAEDGLRIYDAESLDNARERDGDRCGNLDIRIFIPNFGHEL
jgi:hypothetical protein